MFKRKTKAQKIHRLNELQPMVASGRPVLINFFQVGCAPCQVMDGIVNELAREYGETAHVVKADIGKVPGAIETYKIRSTPTTVVIARPPEKMSKKARAEGAGHQEADDGTADAALARIRTRDEGPTPAGARVKRRTPHRGLAPSRVVPRALEAAAVDLLGLLATRYSLRVPRWFRDRRKRLTAGLDDLVPDLLDAVHQPQIRCLAGAEVGLGHPLDPALLLELLHATVIVDRVQRVHTERLPAVLVEDREARHVGRTVCDVDHVSERHPSLLFPDPGVDVDIGVPIDALVDLEERPCLGGVVDRVAEVGDRRSGGRHRELIEVAGRSRGLDEGVRPHAVNVICEHAALDHRQDPGRHDVVLDRDSLGRQTRGCL